MDAYSVEYTDRAKANLKKLDKSFVAHIIAKILQLASKGEAVQHKALGGRWKGFYKVRIDPYRVIYRVDHAERLIIVELIDNRDDVYIERH
ncbi:MAG: type II toxin-antitoxin system RelE family toxin [Aggregatilineales bacterium]